MDSQTEQVPVESPAPSPYETLAKMNAARAAMAVKRIFERRGPGKRSWLTLHTIRSKTYENARPYSHPRRERKFKNGGFMNLKGPKEYAVYDKSNSGFKVCIPLD